MEWQSGAEELQIGTSKWYYLYDLAVQLAVRHSLSYTLSSNHKLLLCS